MLSRVLRGQQTSRAQFKVPSRANLVLPHSRVSLARRLKRAELRQARLSRVPPALVVPPRDSRVRNPKLSRVRPVLAALHKDRQLRQPQHRKPLLRHSKLHPSRQLRQPPQRRPQQLQPRCLLPIYCCRPPWPQPSLVSLAQS